MIIPAQTLRIIKPVDPFCERTVERGMSFGLSAAGYDVRVDQDLLLYSRDFTLASTVERFTMPDDVLGVVHDKSSLARIGITLQNTVIEPGWCGYLTLEITNHSRKTITIYKGQPIAQVVFHRLEAPTLEPYRGKYQNQERGPQPAREER